MLFANKSEGTETVRVDEIVQLCKNGLNRETLTIKKVIDRLENQKLDGGFEILNEDIIISNVEKSVLNQNRQLATQKQKKCCQMSIDWFET